MKYASILIRSKLPNNINGSVSHHLENYIILQNSINKVIVREKMPMCNYFHVNYVYRVFGQN